MFILLKKPATDFIGWYQHIQQQYQLEPYVKIDKPDPFINQIRYQTKEEEIFFLINSNIDNEFRLNLKFSRDIIYKKQAWIWNAENGEREMLQMNSNNLLINLGPAESKLIVFDHAKKGKRFTSTMPANNNRQIKNWTIKWKHIDGSIKQTQMEVLQDVKGISEFVSFCGTIIYRTDLQVGETESFSFLDLGKVHGVSEVLVNEINCGVQWYGKRIYAMKNKLRPGANTIEIRITTTMGNYMKSLKDNPVAQYWTNEKRKNQPLQSMGLSGPVSLY